MAWNYGDILDTVARVTPGDRPALIWGDNRVTWSEFDRRTNNLARRMSTEGLAPGDTVAILCRNHPAYIEAVTAALKSRTVNVNINYRYTADEIAYVMQDCDAAALFYQDTLEAVVPALKDRLPNVRLWIRIESDRAPKAAGSDVSFEAWAQAGDGAPLDIVRSPDDAYLLYTGGTTGRPKGVLWRFNDARRVQLESPLIAKAPKDLAEHAAMVEANRAPSCTIPACPLMHGAGSNAIIGELMAGGTAVILRGDRFDPVDLWREVERNKVTRIAIVGDVFARPMLKALEAEPDRFDVSSLKVISSAGLIWSAEVKAGLLKHLPQATLVDILGASEASGFGYAVARAGEPIMATGVFTPAAKTVLVDPDTDQVFKPGRPAEGLLARSEPIAAGYYKDEKKTAETYRILDGIRYAVPGDFARFDSDGRLVLIGRGNLSINTGGEKVFPEEVEEALKLQPGIEDALVVGEPDPVWGKSIVAIIKSTQDFDEAAVRHGLLKTLAAYKLPRRYLHVEEVPRHESGKSDYRKAQALVAGSLASIA
jgi:fatty-acyl-CoA synthase